MHTFKARHSLQTSELRRDWPPAAATKEEKDGAGGLAAASPPAPSFSSFSGRGGEQIKQLLKNWPAANYRLDAAQCAIMGLISLINHAQEPTADQPIENKEGTEPCPGVSFSYQRWLRLEPGQTTPILMTVSHTPSVSRAMSSKMQTTGFSARIYRHPTRGAGKRAAIPSFLSWRVKTARPAPEKTQWKPPTKRRLSVPHPDLSLHE